MVAGEMNLSSPAVGVTFPKGKRTRCSLPVPGNHPHPPLPVIDIKGSCFRK